MIAVWASCWTGRKARPGERPFLSEELERAVHSAPAVLAAGPHRVSSCWLARARWQHDPLARVGRSRHLPIFPGYEQLGHSFAQRTAEMVPSYARSIAFAAILALAGADMTHNVRQLGVILPSRDTNVRGPTTRLSRPSSAFATFVSRAAPKRPGHAGCWHSVFGALSCPGGILLRHGSCGGCLAGGACTRQRCRSGDPARPWPDFQILQWNTKRVRRRLGDFFSAKRRAHYNRELLLGPFCPAASSVVGFLC